MPNNRLLLGRKCRLIVNKNRDKEDIYETAITAIKTELIACSHELGTLRVTIVVTSDSDTKLLIK